jgi:glycosyltransferase involved in cell wall biosynthesis
VTRPSTRRPKIAITHDWLYGGGAERVVEMLHQIYPDAPIYTSYCTPEWRKKLGGKVVTGYLQNWPFSHLRRFLPLLRQWWFKSLDLSDYDVVISSSGNGEAKFITTKESTVHICYCHIPTHFYWSKYEEYLAHPSMRPHWLARLGLRVLVKPLRKNDYAAAQKVDYFIANSTHTQKQIQQYYDRPSTVIYPPVDVEHFTPPPKGTRSGYIAWGRHVPYKRFDLAIEACNKLGADLTIIGSGPDTERLKKLAGPTIHFPGRMSDKQLVKTVQSASAVLFPNEEDFGLVAVEALAAGTPVIAYSGGGALDIVQDGETGVLFEDQTIAGMINAIRRFETMKFLPATLHRKSKRFDKGLFVTKITKIVEDSLG